MIFVIVKTGVIFFSEENVKIDNIILSNRVMFRYLWPGNSICFFYAGRDQLLTGKERSNRTIRNPGDIMKGTDNHGVII